jgi:DNA-binding transcriptional regulator/RsmH inhibitor MraZ
MTSTQRDAISSPTAGLVIYNSTSNKLNFYNGSAWEVVTSA